MDQSSSSLLLDIDGLVVDRVVRNDAGRRVAHCSTDPQLAGWCPECGGVQVVARRREGHLIRILPWSWDHRRVVRSASRGACSISTFRCRAWMSSGVP